MCSVCWKKGSPKAPLDASAEQVSEPDAVVPTTTAETTEPAAVTEEGAEKLPVQTNKARCWACNKKVGLTGIECRCGYVYCGTHRYADQHECSFDHKAVDMAELAKRNPGGGHFNKVDKL
ncbi:hypothetical protein DYB36_010702 [Aphanomyces astaci]|uniref:AN1-type domain-containing protein n=1 Tax=Aphanomyces astaci TaxID=112090 RepID=A0A396ZZM3_APHAT|nr:hypothetical protein DYB36_010702 [Aphanomyces astaci]